MYWYSILLILFVFNKNINGAAWNTSGLLPWESYLQLGDIERPLGLTLNRSSIAHHHFYIGYLCLHSFMYDEAQEAFDLAIKLDEKFLEPYIGKLLGYKQALWNSTNFIDAQKTYNTTMQVMNSSNLTPTDIQSKLLTTVQQWYINTIDITVGENAFLPLIANLSSSYPNETDFIVLHGLSLLNIADQAQFQTQMEPEKMIEARNILKQALAKEPNHPGLLHYLIHAYDVTQVNISQLAEQYALTYGNIVKTASHAQHMPSHIWMRMGSWNRAVSADGTGLIASFVLCATKILNQTVTISSTSLPDFLSLFNTSNQTQTFLKCDAENRAHSLEWLAYSRLQTGDWSGSISLLADLYTADNKSTLTPNHYLPFAYRTQARTIVELFFWFPYQETFRQRTQQILALNGTNELVSLGTNATRWYPMWSEAAIRFSECLRLLLNNTNNIDNNTNVLINTHLEQIDKLSNSSKTYNQYVSNSILMMKDQTRAIRSYINQSYQDCLNQLTSAVQLENTLIADANTPTLIFARSSELLAMHIILIYSKYKNQTGKASVASNYTLNGTSVSISEFPTHALKYAQSANGSAPNRAINTLGLARAYIQANNKTEAIRYYKILLTQMNSSSNSDPIFLNEAQTTINNYSSTETTVNYNTSTATTMNNHTSTATTINLGSIYSNFSLFIFILFIIFQQ